MAQDSLSANCLVDRSFLARSIRWLEWIVAAELSTKPGVAVTQVGHREIHVRAPLQKELTQLGSPDDVFIEVGRIQDVHHTRDGLVTLAAGVTRLPLIEAVRDLGLIRDIARDFSFDVIASFLGRRNYNRTEIEDTVGQAMAVQLGRRYVQHAASSAKVMDVSWRVHIRDREAIVGLRLASGPLHRRPYKLKSGPGSLHPPVAFSMAALADLQPGSLVIDPCCGAGTILIEAQKLQSDALVIGSDIDVAAIKASRENSRRANVAPRLLVADAGRLPYQRGSVDRVISNLPWGRAVQPSSTLRQEPERFLEEIGRALAHNGRAVLLRAANDAAQESSTLTAPKLEFRIRLFGRWSTISVFRASEGSPLFRTNARLGAALADGWARYRAFDQTG